MKIPYKKIVIKNSKSRKIIINKIDNLLRNGPIIMGPEVEKTERKLAKYLNAKYALLTG